jgi:hypothetical protein
MSKTTALSVEQSLSSSLNGFKDRASAAKAAHKSARKAILDDPMTSDLAKKQNLEALDAGIRATLDGNDYRRRREEALTQLASKIAAQVLDRGEEAVLDALPAFERRIVHKALSEIDGVTTYSEGEEPNRRVVIVPSAD